MSQLSIEKICRFFDEWDEETLEAFDWTPNAQLPNETRRVFRIKDIFKFVHKDYECRYEDTPEGLEECRVEFHTIFMENYDYVIKCRDIKQKMMTICNADNFSRKTNNKSARLFDNQRTDTTNNIEISDTSDENKYGGFVGSAEATQFHTTLDATKRLVETKQIIEKSPDKIMDYLDPNARKYQHTTNIEKMNNKYNKASRSISEVSTKNFNTGTNEYKVFITAANELQALTVKLPKLRLQFCEKFRPLFYR